MPKAGQNLPTPLRRLFRRVFDKVLGENPTFDAIVRSNTTGNTDNDKLQSRLKAISELIRINQAFRTAVRLELANRGIPWPLQ
jgi:hypothetical protein